MASTAITKAATGVCGGASSHVLRRGVCGIAALSPTTTTGPRDAAANQSSPRTHTASANHSNTTTVRDFHVAAVSSSSRIQSHQQSPRQSNPAATPLMTRSAVPSSSAARLFASAAKKRDFYELLGVPKNADKAAIKKAYFQLAKKYHPDTNKVRVPCCSYSTAWLG